MDVLLMDLRDFNDILNNNALFMINGNIKEKDITFYDYKNFINFIINFFINPLDNNKNLVKIIDAYNQITIILEQNSDIIKKNYTLEYNVFISKLNYAYIVYEYYLLFYILYSKILRSNIINPKILEYIKEIKNKDINLIKNIENKFYYYYIRYNNNKTKNLIHKISTNEPYENSHTENIINILIYYIILFINFILNFFQIKNYYGKIKDFLSYIQSNIDIENINNVRKIKYFFLYRFYETFNTTTEQISVYYYITNFYNDFYKYLILSKRDFLTIDEENVNSISIYSNLNNNINYVFDDIKNMKLTNKAKYITLKQNADNCWFVSLIVGVCYSDLNKKLLIANKENYNKYTDKSIKITDDLEDSLKRLVYYIIKNITKNYNKYNKDKFEKYNKMVKYIDKKINIIMNRITDHLNPQKTKSLEESYKYNVLKKYSIDFKKSKEYSLSWFYMYIYKYLYDCLNINSSFVCLYNNKFYFLEERLPDNIEIFILLDLDLFQKQIVDYYVSIFKYQIDDFIYDDENKKIIYKDNNYNIDFCVLSNTILYEDNNDSLKYKTLGGHVISGITYNKKEYIFNSQYYTIKNDDKSIKIPCNLSNFNWKNEKEMILNKCNNITHSALTYMPNFINQNKNFYKCLSFFVIDKDKNKNKTFRESYEKSLKTLSYSDIKSKKINVKSPTNTFPTYNTNTYKEESSLGSFYSAISIKSNKSPISSPQLRASSRFSPSPRIRPISRFSESPPSSEYDTPNSK